MNTLTTSRSTSLTIRFSPLAWPVLCVLGLSLTACGGGDGSSSSINNTPDTTPTTPVVTDPLPSTPILTGDQQAVIGQSVGVVAQVNNSNFNQYQWTQTAGPAVEFLSAQSAAIRFDVPAIGEYDFVFTAKDATGRSVSQTHHISVVNATSRSTGQLRSDRAVSESSTFSIRLSHGTDPVYNWQLVQRAGPTVVFSRNRGDAVFLIKAPAVDQDQVLVFDATGTLDDDTPVRDTVYIVVQNQPTVISPYFCSGYGSYCGTNETLSVHHAYRPQSIWGNRLAPCVFSNQLTRYNLCSVNQLPPLGRGQDVPTIAQIMDRVLVSEDWMGQRFEQFLRDNDQQQDFRKLFGSITSVVISRDINVSFYWAVTGAIYLNPDYFWLTPAERDGVTELSDYRNSYGNALQFDMPWRYVKDNDYVFYAYNPIDRLSREPSEVWPEAASLLYHELAHANDFLPAAQRNTLNGNTSFLNALGNTPLRSDLTAASYPLNSALLTGLASVSFGGEDTTLAQRNTTADTVSQAFFAQGQGGNDYYNFYRSTEDYAMLFEESMMKLRYGLDRDVAVSSFIRGIPITGEDLLVTRGQRNRISDPNVAKRARIAVQDVLPSALPLFDAQIGTLRPTELCQGIDWVSAVNTNCAAPLLANRYRSASALIGKTPAKQRIRFSAPLPPQ